MTSLAMPGRSMTWWLWLNDYDPVELIVDGETTTEIGEMLQWMHGRDHQFGIAIGDEWRANDGRWSMRGKAVEREADSSTR